MIYYYDNLKYIIATHHFMIKGLQIDLQSDNKRNLKTTTRDDYIIYQ